MDINSLKKKVINSLQNYDPDKLSSIDNQLSKQEKITYDTITNEWNQYNKTEQKEPILNEKFQKEFNKMKQWKDIGCFQLYNSPEEKNILGLLYFQNSRSQFFINSPQFKKILDEVDGKIMILTYIFRE